MKPMRSLLGIILIAAVSAAQPGCSFLVGKAAVGVGKKVYKKVKDDKPKNQQDKQDKQDQQDKQDEQGKQDGQD